MLNDEALDETFRKARTYNSFSGSVTDEQLRAIWDVMKFGDLEARKTTGSTVLLV